MKKLLWLAAAARDMQRLQAFIEKENLYAALRALQKIRGSVNILMEFPEIGVRMPRLPTTREWSVTFRVWHSREKRE